MHYAPFLVGAIGLLINGGKIITNRSTIYYD